MRFVKRVGRELERAQSTDTFMEREAIFKDKRGATKPSVASSSKVRAPTPPEDDPEVELIEDEGPIIESKDPASEYESEEENDEGE